MKAEDITKGSTLLATLNEENFPFGMHKDLIDDLHRMINIALNTPVLEQICSHSDKYIVPGIFGGYWCQKCARNVDKEL